MNCPHCGGPVSLRPMPTGYFGPGTGALLYHYTRLLSADVRYSVDGKRFAVAMCDPCQNAIVVSRSGPDAAFQPDEPLRGDPASDPGAGDGLGQ